MLKHVIRIERFVIRIERLKCVKTILLVNLVCIRHQTTLTILYPSLLCCRVKLSVSPSFLPVVEIKVFYPYTSRDGQPKIIFFKTACLVLSCLFCLSVLSVCLIYLFVCRFYLSSHVCLSVLFVLSVCLVGQSVFSVYLVSPS